MKNKDLSKQLDVVPGATVYMAPKDGAGVLTTFEKGDKAEITGLHGGWTQIRLEKTLVGYVQAQGAAAPAPEPVAAAAPAPAAAPAGATAPAASAPPSSGANPAPSRLFEGTLASTHKLLGTKPPYDWQLSDADGNRVAYVDLSKLLLTDQIENYSGHPVVVLGALSPVPDSTDLVIAAEGLRLK